MTQGDRHAKHCIRSTDPSRKTDEDREAIRSCTQGERKAAFQASRARHGITREAVWIQSTPGGDLAVVSIEAHDLQKAFAGLGSSQDPFDVWFRELVRDVHGINLEDGFPPPEQIMDFQSDPTSSRQPDVPADAVG